MNMAIVTRALTLVVLAHALPAWAQLEIHATPGRQAAASPEQLTACVQSQRQVMALVDAGHQRLELARQTNDAAAMRAAFDEFQATLSSIKAQLASCAEVVAAAPAAGPHAGHAMPTAPDGRGAAPGPPAMRPGSTTSAPGAAAAAPSPREASPTAPSTADPHAGHTMPGARLGSPAQPATRPAQRPSATPEAKPASPAADPHAGPGTPTSSSSAAKPAATPPDLVEDPVSKAKVDPQTSLRVLHRGKMYYFRSDTERQEFMRNPEKYVSAK